MGTAERSGVMNAAVEMVRAALAEAGYPDALIYETVWGDAAFVASANVPMEAYWRAGAILGPAQGYTMTCWPCWKANGYSGEGLLGRCQHDTWDNAPPVVRP